MLPELKFTASNPNVNNGYDSVDNPGGDRVAKPTFRPNGMPNHDREHGASNQDSRQTMQVPASSLLRR
jgi:hypothetical protein